MPEHKPFLPPHIGKWLASKKPELLAKAEAALRASEPDANDFLLEREKKSASTIPLWECSRSFRSKWCGR